MITPDSALGPPLIGALLRMPADAVVAAILEGLHEAGFTDIVPAHFNILRYPGPQGRRPSDLAAETRMTKQAVNYLLGQLEQLGYITRGAHPADQRSKRVQLTQRGREAAKCIRATVRHVETEWERELGERQFAQLRRLLVRLNATERVRASQSSPARA